MNFIFRNPDLCAQVIKIAILEIQISLISLIIAKKKINLINIKPNNHLLLVSIIAINFQMTLRLMSVDFRVYGRVQGIIQSNINKLLIFKNIFN